MSVLVVGRNQKSSIKSNYMQMHGWLHIIACLTCICRSKLPQMQAIPLYSEYNIDPNRHVIRGLRPVSGFDQHVVIFDRPDKILGHPGMIQSASPV